jgi:predicted Fe-Mo cluster-binding NifX family protein
MNFIKYILAEQVKNPFFYAVIVSFIGSGMMAAGNSAGIIVFAAAMSFMIGSLLTDIIKWKYQEFKRDQQ